MTPIQDLTISERHRVVAGRFGELVEHTTDWDAPAPVAGWTARDVVTHLTSWFPAFLASGAGIALRCDVDDPRSAWRCQTSAIQAVLDDPQSADQEFIDRHSGAMPVAEAIDMFYTPDVFMHSWDLARATGQPSDLDLAFCAHLLHGMEQHADAIRASGQYGEAVEVPADAGAQIRLLGFIGRDPFWSAANQPRADTPERPA